MLKSKSVKRSKLLAKDETHESCQQNLRYSGSKLLKDNSNQIGSITNVIPRFTNKSGYCIKATTQNKPDFLSGHKLGYMKSD